MKTKFFTALSLMALILSFQNCGTGFQPGIDGSGKKISFASGSNGYFAGMVSVRKGAIFRVVADPTKIPSGARVFWDNIYSDGLRYCEQTTSLDQSTTDFYCTQDGVLTVSFQVYRFGEDTPETETLMIVIGTPGSVSDSQPSGGGQGSNGPTPEEMTPGQRLYFNNCRDCHGDIGQSTKRGLTRMRLDSAINAVPAMQTLVGLSAQDRDLIVQSLQ